MSPPCRPLVESLRGEPASALRALADLPHAFLLHSALAREDARWSFLGADPFLVCRGGDARAHEAWRVFARPASDERCETGAPFSGGVVGYWAYDLGRRLERLPERAADDLGLPDAVLGFYDVVAVFDHANGRAWLVSCGLPEAGERQAERARQRLDFFAGRLAPAASDSAISGRADSSGAWRASAEPVFARSTFTPDGYRRAVETVKDHIRRGDIFQANLSQRWSLPLAGGGAHRALALFDALARHSPAPHAAYFDAGDHAVVSSSPERFLRLAGRAVETRPIKGTRPTSDDTAEDARLAAELLASAKDRAENVMIVDVLRNDLGRVCATGSVETPELCALERFAQVHHLVSTVTGRLRDGVSPFDLLHACFPGGSITGAPKIRAMEIIESLEPVRRHVYTGAVGYVGWNGDADWNIAIRTALVTPRAIHFAAGGGITADSDPAAEFEETLHKAEGIRLALADVVGPVALAERSVPA